MDMQLTPKFVVFTGPASTRHGKPVLRADLKAFAEKHGYVVQGAVNARTMMLVASRADTVKARRAFDKGIEVVSFGQFIASLGGFVPESGGQFDPYADSLVGPAKVVSDDGDYL
jgi:NAD-dependent DNA ligase